MALDLEQLRADFPVLQRKLEGRALIYLDSAATSLTPRAVTDAVVGYYAEQSANVHRGKHTLSEEASDAFERARGTIASFIGAAPREIVLTSGTTAAINLVAAGLPFAAGDNVVTTLQEHHSNFVPWLGRAEVRVCPVGEDGRVDPDAIERLVDDKTRLVAVSQASNATGAIHEVTEIIARVRASGSALVLVDGAQGAPHLPVDVAALDCDFYAFSAHKVLGPTGAGALYGKRAALEQLTPAVRGGGMVDLVTQTAWTPKAIPFRFEAGTPNIAGSLGFAAALKYQRRLGWDDIVAHEEALSARLTTGLSGIPGTRLLGPPEGAPRLPLASLVIDSDKVAADHVAMMLSDTHKIMVRSGHHCCHPYFDALGTTGSVRISAHVYNTVDEIDEATAAIRALLGRLLS